MNPSASAEAKKFLTVLTVILAGIWLSDYAIGTGMRFLYQKQRSGLLYRTSFAIDSTRAQYVVLGSSRANHDYDPGVFEKQLASTFYNCGRDKQGLLYSCAVLSAILERYHPKCIIVDIRPDEFTQSDAGTLATLLPYYRNPAVRPYLDFNSHFESVKLLSHIYPYNSLLTNLVVGLKKDWKEDYKGFRPLHNQNTYTPLEKFEEGNKTDSTKLHAFTRLLDHIRDLKIPVFLVISPIRYQCNNPVTAGICAKLASNAVSRHYLDFANDTAFMDNRYYSDNNHLNAFGAAYFSGAVARRISGSNGLSK